jgi:hypothetical protein
MKTTARTPVFTTAFDDGAATSLAPLLWEAAAVDAAVLATGVAIGVLIGRWSK